MISKNVIFLFLFLSFYSFSFAQEPAVIPLHDKKGIDIFSSSKFNNAFWPLSQYYEAQLTGTYCGIASSVMVLNALNVPRPVVWEDSPSIRLFTQDNFFSAEVSKLIDKETVRNEGLTLPLLAKAIATWQNVQTTVVYSNELTEESFRKLLQDNLVHTDQFIIANYNRRVVQGMYGGHFSPIAAYDQDSDSILVMDVYRHEFTATWVKLPQFLAAMIAIDSDSNLPRGLLLVKTLMKCNDGQVK